ncbi:MAG TPA: hypothetical protein VJX74_18445 [Blastocatellia bacterium]|nr:hypothetical protein [Blastocatellia bacterium]
MEMEKAYYVVTYKPAYIDLLRGKSAQTDPMGAAGDDPAPQRLILSITQGGFGQDIVDDERQAKERFLEYLFYSDDIDLPRSAEVFDQYFEFEQADELIDLDEEL